MEIEDLQAQQHPSRAQKIVEHAAHIISKGGLIIFPSETSYGIGVDSQNPAALDKLYKLKLMNPNKPVSVAIAHLDNVRDQVIVPEYAEILAEAFLPGPLTLILPYKDKDGGLGVRIPDHAFCLALAKKLNRPFTATSANISGQPDAYSVDDLLRQFETKLKEIDLIVGNGKLKGTLPSTIVEFQANTYNILRVGPISQEQIDKALKG